MCRSSCSIVYVHKCCTPEQNLVIYVVVNISSLCYRKQKKIQNPVWGTAVLLIRVRHMKRTGKWELMLAKMFVVSVWLEETDYWLIGLSEKKVKRKIPFFQLLKCECFLVSLLLCDNKLNVSLLLTKQDICGLHLVVREKVTYRWIGEMDR